MERGDGGSQEHWLGHARGASEASFRDASEQRRPEHGPFWDASEQRRPEHGQLDEPDSSPRRRGIPGVGEGSGIKAHTPTPSRDSGKVSHISEFIDNHICLGSFRFENDTVFYHSPQRFFPDPEKVVDAIQDKGEDAFAGFVAGKIESAILDRILESWPANGEAALANDAQYPIVWDAGLHEEIGRLTTELLSDANIPGSVLGGSIAQLIPIDCLDKSLGDVGLIIEIAGVVVCILSGNPVLGCACFKALTHDLAHRALGAAIKYEIKYLIADDHPRNSASDKSPALAETIAPSTYRSTEHPTGIQPVKTAGAPPTIHVAWHVQTTDRPSQSKFARTNPPTGTSVPAESAIRADSRGAAPAALTGAPGPIKSTVRTDTPSESRSGVQEGYNTSAVDSCESDNTKLAQPAAAGQAAVGQTEKLTFVRLCVHYELLDPTLPVADSTRPGRLIRLIVVRESTPVFLPESSNIMDDTGKQNANRQADYVARQLEKAGQFDVLQLWRTADEDALTLDPVAVAALEANLGCIFVGLPANLDGTGLTGQELSGDDVLHLLGPGTRCIQVMGFIAEKSGRSIVQCVGSKPRSTA